MVKIAIHFVSGESITINSNSKINGSPAPESDILCGSILNRAGEVKRIKIESDSTCYFINPAHIAFIELLSEAD